MPGMGFVPGGGEEMRRGRCGWRDARPPAFRITWASPSSSPSSLAGWSRASMHVRTATCRAGGIGRSPWVNESAKLRLAVSIFVSSDMPYLLGTLDAILAFLDPLHGG